MSASAARNHAKPCSTISMPTRLSGRLRHAYSPVPMNVQPMRGHTCAHTVWASSWSLVSTTAIATAPHTSAAAITARMRRSVMPTILAAGAAAGKRDSASCSGNFLDAKGVCGACSQSPRKE